MREEVRQGDAHGEILGCDVQGNVCMFTAEDGSSMVRAEDGGSMLRAESESSAFRAEDGGKRSSESTWRHNPEDHHGYLHRCAVKTSYLKARSDKPMSGGGGTG
jgi:hypothetical protein